jgi:hypothetical protein
VLPPAFLRALLSALAGVPIEPGMLDFDPQFTLAEAATFKGCSPRTIMRWVEAKKLIPCDDLGTGSRHNYRFKRSDLETINRPKVATPAPEPKPRTTRGRRHSLPYQPQTMSL